MRYRKVVAIDSNDLLALHCSPALADRLWSSCGCSVLAGQGRSFLWPAPQKDSLSAKITAALGDGVATPLMDSDSQIFVVHGRDHDSRDQLELVLRRLGLEPFILQVTGGGGDTLIESLERMIGKALSK